LGRWADELVEASKEEAVPKLGGFEVMNRTIDIAQAGLARHSLAATVLDELEKPTPES
jgi:NTE family protein